MLSPDVLSCPFAVVVVVVVMNRAAKHQFLSSYVIIRFRIKQFL